MLKNVSFRFCLMIVAFFGSVGMGFALPTCQGSPIIDRKIQVEMTLIIKDLDIKHIVSGEIGGA